MNKAIFPLFTVLVLIISACTGKTVSNSALPSEGTAQKEKPLISLTLIPPSLVTDQIVLEIRGAVWNRNSKPETFEVSFYLDKEESVPDRLFHKGAGALHQQTLEVPADSARAVFFRWPTKGQAGKHRIILVAKSGAETRRMVRPIEIIASDVPTTRRIDGAWAGITHWGESEGKPWNYQIRKMTDDHWKELVHGMHEIGMDIIVIVESHRKNKGGSNNDEADHAAALCYYDSKMNPGRVEFAARDPFDAILTAADELEMYVFIPLGSCQWKNYSIKHMEWSMKVATELWEMYGHHPSFFGWYVSGEGDGDANDNQKEAIFFRGLQAHCRGMAPDKPLLLAPNTIGMHNAIERWRPVLEHCDIICPFGFHRFDGGEEAARGMQKLCDETRTHLWMDMEVFLFGDGLIPRPISGIISDFNLYPNFEKILCFQYPGLMTSPEASVKLGGEAAVNLYLDYKTYLEGQ